VKRSRYKDEQVGFVLKEAETGTPVAEVIGCRNDPFERRHRSAFRSVGLLLTKERRAAPDEIRRRSRDILRTPNGRPLPPRAIAATISSG
jgi:hypothetical protein